MNRTVAAIAIGLFSVAGGCKSQYAVDKPEPVVDHARSEVRSQRRQVFDEALRLSPADARAFWPIYAEYDGEWKKLGDQRVKLIQEYARNYHAMSNDVARDLLQQSLDVDARRVDLRTRYARQIESATSAVTAGRFAQIDHRLQLAADTDLMSILPPLPKPR